MSHSENTVVRYVSRVEYADGVVRPFFRDLTYAPDGRLMAVGPEIAG